MRIYLLGRTTSLLLALCFVGELNANPIEDYKKASVEYKEEYLKYLKFKNTSSVELRKKLQNLKNAEGAIQSKELEIQNLYQEKSSAETNLETIPFKIAFQGKAIQQANLTQNQIKQTAKNSQEFDGQEDVSPKTIDQKISLHNQSIQKLKAHIAQLEKDITNIESGPEYQALLSQKGKAQSLLRQRKNEASRLRSEVSSLEDNVADTRRNLYNKESEVREAKDRQSNIRHHLIPELKRDISYKKQRIDSSQNQIRRNESEHSRLVSEESQLESEVSRHGRSLQESQSKIQELQSRISRLRSELSSAPPEKKSQIEGEIRRLQDHLGIEEQKASLSRQGLQSAKIKLDQVNHRRNSLVRENRQLQSEISRLENEIRWNESEISSLEREHWGLDSKIRDLEYSRDRIKDELADLERDLSSKTYELSRAEQRVRAAESQLYTARAQIAAYREKHIQPIEKQIKGLEHEIAQFNQRIDTLNGWKTALLRQDQNIKKATENIERLEKFKGMLEKQVADFDKNLESKNKELHQLKQVHLDANRALERFKKKMEQALPQLVELENELEKLKNKIIQ